MKMTLLSFKRLTHWSTITLCALWAGVGIMAQAQPVNDTTQNTEVNGGSAYLPHPDIRAYYPNINNCAKLDIITPEGKKLPEFLFDNQKWVEGTENNKYVVRVQNNCQRQIRVDFVIGSQKVEAPSSKLKNDFIVNAYDSLLVDNVEGHKLTFNYQGDTKIRTVEANFYQRHKKLAERAENENLNKNDFETKPFSTAVMRYEAADYLIKNKIAKEDELLKNMKRY